VRKQAKDLSIVERFAANAERVIVAGSTWPQDEEYFARYLSERAGVKLVLVPHEIDAAHMQRIFHLFEGRYMNYTRARLHGVEDVRVLLVDTIGLLSSIYRYGHVAYIGGGFGVGIHNTLEAAAYGIPVVFGPEWQKFREAHGLIDAGAAIPVKNYQEFSNALDTAFDNQKTMGQAAANYVNSECGATEIILKTLKL
jgi:3-deoxy-D-manno-octulosonic-acid transferase